MNKETSSDRRDGDSAELMYVRCATCGTWMDVKPGHITGITHGICPSCFELEMKRLDRDEGRRS